MTRLAILLRSALLILTLVCVSQTMARSQKYKVTIKAKEQRLLDVFKTIQKQTNLIVFYSNTILNDQEKVSIQVKDEVLEKVLDQIVAGKALKYEVQEKYIVISPKEEKKSLGSITQGLNPGVSPEPPPTIDVRGRITDEDGNPLMGASVMIKGTKLGTQTNADGYFILKGVDEKAVLEISYVGFEKRELSAGGMNSTRTLTLKRKESPLDAVQIIAYGKTSKRFTTSNTGTVTREEIERQPVNNVLLALQARVPGLEITQATGVAGGGVTVRIQGRNNLNSSLVGSDPLIVIDGVPYISQNLSTFLGGSDAGRSILGRSGDGVLSGSFGNPLSYINPSDIESVDVLKDADATAIYGSRAANGAILITTKKGKAGPMQVNLNIQQGWGKVGHTMDLLNSEQYMEMRREAKLNDNASILPTDYDLRGLWDTTRYTDWQRELIGGTAQYSNITAGISGGTETVRYLFSSTYGRETSVFPGDFANTRASVHFNVSAASPNQRLKVQLGGSYMHNDNKLPGLDFTRAALNTVPVAPSLYNEDGTLYWAPDSLQNGNSSWINPLAQQYILFDTKTGNLIANGNLSYRILPGLELKSSFGFSHTSSDQFVGALNESLRPEARLGRLRSANFSFNDVKSWIVEPQLNYNKKLGDGTLNLLVGGTIQQQRSEGRGFAVSGQPTDVLLRNMAAGNSFSPNALDIALYRYGGGFARFSYSYKTRYLVNITGRRDGSSRFGANNQVQNFGAVGLGWILSEESFVKNALPFLSFAKLRGSFGSTGNDQLGNYRFMNLYDVVNPSVFILYQGQAGLAPASLPNPNLKWELTRKLQGGIDLGFLKDRILLTVNYTRNRTSNSLTTIKLPFVAGFNSIIDNLPALIQNTGWEFSLNTENFQLGDFSWSTSANLTIPRNKLLAFPNLENSPFSNQLIIGQPLSTVRRHAFYGVDPLTGTFLVADRHGNPTTNPSIDDRIIYPFDTRCYGGLSNNFRYKGFELNFFFQFCKKFSPLFLEFDMPGRMLSSTGNQPVGVLQRWRMPGDITTYQRFTTTATLPREMGNRDFGDASYVRLKNLSLAYQIPPSNLKKWSIQQLRLFVNAQNLWTLTRYQGLDPETGSISSLPPLRMIVVGINAAF